MSKWPKIQLEELADTTAGSIAIGPFGSRMKSDVYTSSGVPVIRGTNISSTRAWENEWVYVSDNFADQLPNCNVREGDLVFPHRGSIGTVAIVPGDLPRYMLSTSLMKFRPRSEKVLPLFLFYYFRSPAGRAEIMQYSSQVGTPGIGQPLTSLRQFLVPFPPREEQERIAGVLSVLDDKIELNRRMNETLEAIAQAIFKDWFVDFGPTCAKAEGRTPYLAPEIWDLFPDALDDEDKPIGWSPDTLESLAITNAESWTAKKHPSTIEYVDLSNAKWGNIEFTAVLDWTAAPSRARRIAKTGDTIVGTTRPGNGSFSYISRDGLTVSTGFAVLTPHRDSYRDFVYIAATRAENIERLANLADGHGGAYPAVKPKDVSDTVIIVPQDEVMVAFAKITAPLREKIEQARDESISLAKTRDLLLPKLMSGELRLRDAEKATEAVA